MGRGVFLLGQTRPYRKGAVPQRSPILGFPSIYAYPTKFYVVTHMGWGVVLSQGQPRLPSQRDQSSMAPQLLGFLFMPTPFNAERPNSAPMGGVFSRGQPAATPVYLHNARFVGDSRVLIALQQSLPKMQSKQLIFLIHDVDTMAKL